MAKDGILLVAVSWAISSSSPALATKRASLVTLESLILGLIQGKKVGGARRYAIGEEWVDARTFVLFALHRAQPLLGFPQ